MYSFLIVQCSVLLVTILSCMELELPAFLVQWSPLVVELLSD